MSAGSYFRGRQKEDAMLVVIGVLASIGLMAAARQPEPAPLRVRAEKTRP